MEIADVEFVTQLFLRALAQFLNFERSDLVSERLTGDRNIAFHFRHHLGFGHATVLEHEIDCLLPGPAFCMQAGIDDQPHGAQLLVLQGAIAIPRIVEKAHRVAQCFGIERPAFDIGRVTAEPHEGGQIGVFLRKADLEMMARRAFVQIQRDIAGRQAARQIIGVEIERARARSIRGAGIVRSARFELFAIFFVWLDLERCLGNEREIFADLRINLLADIVVSLRQRLAAFRLELRVGANVVEKLVERAFETDLLLDFFHPVLDPRDFGQTEIVQIVRLQGQRGRIFDKLSIEFSPTLHLRQAHRVARDRHIFVPQEIAKASVNCIDFSGPGSVFLGQPGLVFI